MDEKDYKDDKEGDDNIEDVVKGNVEEKIYKDEMEADDGDD